MENKIKNRIGLSEEEYNKVVKKVHKVRDLEDKRKEEQRRQAIREHHEEEFVAGIL